VSENRRVISIFRKRNFTITHDEATSTVFFEKEINK